MPDPRTEAALRDATDTEGLAIGPGALDTVAEVFGRTFAEQPAMVVADATTWEVAGERVQRALEAGGRPTDAHYRFPPDSFVKAEYGIVVRLRESLGSHD
ncbi:MAG: sn-glycerol-1-phosphate dehydrogenase, partial [Actinomycetes bacterium]